MRAHRSLPEIRGVLPAVLWSCAVFFLQGCTVIGLGIGTEVDHARETLGPPTRSNVATLTGHEIRYELTDGARGGGRLLCVEDEPESALVVASNRWPVSLAREVRSDTLRLAAARVRAVGARRTGARMWLVAVGAAIDVVVYRHTVGAIGDMDLR